MDKLRIPLSAFPERGLPIDVTVSEEELRPDGAKEMAVGPVRVKGHVTRVDDDYMFRGDVTGTYHHTCDRCLVEAQAPFTVDAVWVFTTDAAASGELSDADGDSDGADDTAFPVHIESDVIDLRPLVWEEVVLNAPSKFLCREECAGLCPQCGANLNRETCRCSPDEEKPSSSGLAKLAELFPDLANEEQKEKE